MVERLYSYFFLSLIKYTFIPEKGGKQQPTCNDDIDQPTMLEYILASVRARLCVLAPRLSQGTAGWLFAVN